MAAADAVASARRTADVHAPPPVVHLFTDIEGSTGLWERHPAQMRAALAAHDAIVREAVAAHGGRIVKSTGDGVHAAFDDALAAVGAMLALQRALAEPARTAGLALAVRCGVHRGADEARDNDYYGPDVNRAARIMAAAHGGQMLLSQAVADDVAARLPEGSALRPLGAVRLRDLSQPERLAQLVAPPLREAFPALRSLEATPNNLGQQFSRFIGRAEELAALRRLVDGNRLVTLFGPGGIGKSRLSLQLGAELLDDFPDGVWLVELAPLPAAAGEGADGARRLASAVAGSLRLRERPGEALDDTLLAFLARRRLLLILDNCEHVHAAAAALARRLLQAAPELKLLASSREALHLQGEAVYPVPSLPAPEAVARPAPEALMRHAAVHLFVDRATAAQPGFRLEAESAAAVAEICRRVDGIPLAIELAASRVRALPVQAIAARLRDSLAVLAVRDETVPPRQRTLRALIDWSHALLSPGERVLFRRLAVFAGSFGLDAAEAVCADGGVLAAGDVFELLAQLVERSLVAPVHDERDAEPRYRLLGTVRQFAAEQLADAEGPAAALHLRHLAHARALAERAEAGMGGHEQPRWLARLDAEAEHLLGAVSWCAQARPEAAQVAPAALRAGVEDALQVCYRLRLFWLNRGLLTLGVDTSLAVLAHPLAAARDAVRARGLASVGKLCSFMGRYAQARALLTESQAIAEETGDHQAAAMVLQPLGIATIGLGDSVAARQCFERSEQLARAEGDDHQLAAAVNAIAQVDRIEGRLDDAQRRYGEFLALARAFGDREYEAVGLLNLAMVGMSRGEAGAVPAQLLQVVAIADASRSRPLAMGVLDVCTALAAQRREWVFAAGCQGVADALAQVAGLTRDAVDQAFLAPYLAEVKRALGGADFAAAATAARREPIEVTQRRIEAWLRAFMA